jgi:hypothetical protein
MDADDDLGSATAARSVQVLTAISMLTENLVRARQYAAWQHADRDAAVVREHRVEQLAEHAAALTGYGVTADPGWARRATVVDAARAWSAAHHDAGRDPAATVAQQCAEAVLRRHSPVAMARYDALRADGVDALAAMQQAAPLFLAAPTPARLLSAARAADAEAGAEQAQAYTLRATPDIAATPANEAHTAGQRAARHQGDADVAAARTAPAVAAQAYPVPVDGARTPAARPTRTPGPSLAAGVSPQRWNHEPRRPR